MNWVRVRYDDIQEFEVIKTTAQRITYLRNGREYTEAKVSNWQMWFETNGEAIEWLRNQKLKELNWAETKFNNCKKVYEEFNAKHPIA